MKKMNWLRGGGFVLGISFFLLGMLFREGWRYAALGAGGILTVLSYPRFQRKSKDQGIPRVRETRTGEGL